MGAAELRVALCVLAWPLALAAQAPGGFNLSEPEPGIFVHIGRHLALDSPGHEDIANIGFIVGEKCVAVVDSGGSVGIGRELRTAIKKHASAPICYVINTHGHVDHVLGNSVFRIDRPRFVGSFRLREAIDRSREFFVKEYAADMDSPADPEAIIAPDLAVEHELTLDLGGRQLALRAWPKAHSDSDLTVYDARTRTLWTGDLLFRERLPALDGSLTGWLSVLQELSGKQVALAVPGHGRVTRDLASAIVPERRYLKALADGIGDELVRGRPLNKAMEHVGSAEKSAWVLWDDVHPHNVVRAYEELEWK